MQIYIYAFRFFIITIVIIIFQVLLLLYYIIIILRTNIQAYLRKAPVSRAICEALQNIFLGFVFVTLINNKY